jgi:hypothetical protein
MLAEAELLRRNGVRVSTAENLSMRTATASPRGQCAFPAEAGRRLSH